MFIINLCVLTSSSLSSFSFYKHPSFSACRPERARGCHVCMHWAATLSFSSINPCWWQNTCWYYFSVNISKYCMVLRSPNSVPLISRFHPSFAKCPSNIIWSQRIQVKITCSGFQMSCLHTDLGHFFCLFCTFMILTVLNIMSQFSFIECPSISLCLMFPYRFRLRIFDKNIIEVTFALIASHQVKHNFSSSCYWWHSPWPLGFRWCLPILTVKLLLSK